MSGINHQPQNLNSAKRRVLLYIEDDDATAYLFQRAVNDSGMQIQLFRVSDGEQALSFLHRNGSYRDAPRPDLVVIDVNLPRVDGFDVLADMKRSEWLRRISTVIFTSSARAEDIDRARQLGADRYVTKKADLSAFLKAASDICGLLGSSPALRSA